MTEGIKRAWTEMVQPLLRRPPECQVAALCVRDGQSGPEVLVVTSRGSGRWVIPKGWLMEGKTAAEAAQLEAWEEAGVKSAACDGEPIGHYSYDKRLDDGYVTPVEVQVYRMTVTETADIFPEARERNRRWISPSKAAELVDEPSLQAIFRQM
ncbi:NUDIX hydrolase [Roseovarius sp. A21]|uniref:NUDIX hydrolase n=1 Tax=Roseovarius bejariae TaxID=2576383 RepID=A0A844CWP9_9RHOB|nr:NUDIX hydrolase [Roseovarius bejariae]MRU15070.1 NUDIX hydrolase [Roseovarius bejariae]